VTQLNISTFKTDKTFIFEQTSEKLTANKLFMRENLLHNVRTEDHIYKTNIEKLVK